MSRSRELLWIVPKWPLPADDGARVATVQLLRELAGSGHAIDLVALATPDERVDEAQGVRELGLRSATVVRREPSRSPGVGGALRLLGSLLSQPMTPLTVAPFAASTVRAEVNRLVSGRSAIVYDGLHPAAHSASRGRYQRPEGAARVIYRAHNFESDLWARKARQVTQPLLQRFFSFQAERVRELELSLVRAADGVAPVSGEDLALFQGAVPGARGRVVPIGHEFAGPLPYAPAEDSTLPLMFLGRLDWPPNREGLHWFLSRVWPEAFRRCPRLRLSIAGSGESAWLRPLLEQPGVDFLGRVERVEDLYARSLVSLVPVFYGSGTRVKVIEASRFGRACLSTALGVEGTGLEPGRDYLRAEGPDEWIEALASLDLGRARALGEAAHRTLRETFDARRSAREFAELLHGA